METPQSLWHWNTLWDIYTFINSHLLLPSGNNQLNFHIFKYRCPGICIKGAIMARISKCVSAKNSSHLLDMDWKRQRKREPIRRRYPHLCDYSLSGLITVSWALQQQENTEQGMQLTVEVLIQNSTLRITYLKTKPMNVHFCEGMHPMTMMRTHRNIYNFHVKQGDLCV